MHLIDISAAALEATETRLASVPARPRRRHQATYDEGLASLPASIESNTRTLVLFLGSNIGNFDVSASRDLLKAMRRALRDGDNLLLGADLIKPEADLLAAYDDPLGVTAAFNKNLLVRINRELGGQFDLGTFDHRAVWNAREHRIEMHLVSRIRQDVWIESARSRRPVRRRRVDLDGELLQIHG